MDYKKKYEQALGRANAKIETYNHLGNASVVKSICEIFPELRENEDERIKTNIIKLLRFVRDTHHQYSDECNESINWLEKQCSIGKINEKLRQYREYLVKETERWHKNEEDETLSKIGKQDCIGHANAYISARAEFEDLFNYDSWLKKQGDANKEYWRGYREGKQEILDKYAELEKRGKKIDAIENFDTEFEKQVSYLIASAINKEHEYNQNYVKWTANALLNYAKHELEKQGEQKPAWSEEDAQYIDDTLALLSFGCSSHSVGEVKNWLKSLKNRVQPKQEWSEEEKARIDKIINVLDWAEEKGHIRYSDWEDCVCYVKSLKPQNTWSEDDENILNEFVASLKYNHEQGYNRQIDWLKSLKERVGNFDDGYKVGFSAAKYNQWKPSDEQMEALWDVIPHIPNSEKDIDTITELSVLYEDLKKLKEE